MADARVARIQMQVSQITGFITENSFKMEEPKASAAAANPLAGHPRGPGPKVRELAPAGG